MTNPKTTEQIMPTGSEAINQPITDTSMISDYTPGYNMSLSTEAILEGTRIVVNANAASGPQNLVDIDVNDKEAVDALYQKYLDKGVDVWAMLYPGTKYSYFDTSNVEEPFPYYGTLPDGANTNAYKLVKAVQFYEYLNFGETSNVEYNPYGDNLMAVNSAESPDNRIPYSEYMSEITPYRVPPMSQWNMEVFYDKDGRKVDRDGNIIPTFYVDEDLSPVIIPKDEGTQEEKIIYSVAIQLANAFRPHVITDNNLSDYVGKSWTSYTDSDMTFLRTLKAALFTTNIFTLPFAPQTLSSTRRLGMKLAGTHLGELTSLETLKKAEYQVPYTKPNTPYEWGGPYAGPRTVGFVVDGDMWNEGQYDDGYGPLGEIAKPKV